MIVSNRHKYVFISTPKSGTHTMFAYLAEQWAGDRKEPFHRRKIPAGCENHFAFSTVRNPFVRAVSSWWHLLFRDPYRTIWRPIIGTFDFVKFCEFLVRGEIPAKRGDVVCMPQHQWLEGIRLDAVLHIENLNAEFSQLPFVVAADAGKIEIPRRLSSGGQAEISDYGDWREVMSDPAAELIQQWAIGVFDRFGYSRDWRAA